MMLMMKRGTREFVPSRTDRATGAQSTERILPSRREDRGSCPYLKYGIYNYTPSLDLRLLADA